MRHITRTLILALSLAVAAAACGSGDDAGSGTTTTTTAAETTTTSTVAADTTTTTEAAGIVPGEDPDVDAVVEAYLVVFDSETTFEEKAPYLVDPTGLEDTVVGYTAAGEAVGGITLEATAVTIDGDAAAVTYNFLFAGNPTYQGLEADAVKTEAGWQITRETFCGIMSSARVGCPAE
jgi:hypothetical protein